MNTDETRMGQIVHRETTSQIIGAAFEVHNTLVTGFWKRYQRAMQDELIKRGSQAELEVPIKVFYKSALVGEYYADLLVDGSVMVEIKVAKCYKPEDEAQLLNELKATAVKVGMLVNFGRERVQYKRMIL